MGGQNAGRLVQGKKSNLLSSDKKKTAKACSEKLQARVDL
jgi:hypothetical protein